MHSPTIVVTACLFTLLVVESMAKPATKSGVPSENKKIVRMKRASFEYPPDMPDDEPYPEDKRLAKKFARKRNFGMVLGGGYKFGGKPSQYNFRRYYRREEPEVVLLQDEYPYNVDVDDRAMDRRRRAGFSRVLSGGWRGTYFGKRSSPFMDSEPDDIRELYY